MSKRYDGKVRDDISNKFGDQMESARPKSFMKEEATTGFGAGAGHFMDSIVLKSNTAQVRKGPIRL